MRTAFIKSGRCAPWGRLLLLALLLRAYVPVGFMPASGGFFTVELCPAAMPMPMPMVGHHHHHDGIHSQGDECPFGGAPGAGPLSQVILWVPPDPIESRVFVPTEVSHLGFSLPRAHQPRGPPSLV